MTGNIFFIFVSLLSHKIMEKREMSGCQAGRLPPRWREKSKMRLGLSPEGCPKQDKEAFLKKSHKIIFFKADFFTHIIL